MAFASPNVNGWTKFPADLKGWTVVDLDTDNFHITQQGGLAAHWAITNPTASTLRVQNDGHLVENWYGTGTQTGPILILKVGAIDPRPDYADPAGVSPNQWRCEDAQLTVQIRYSVGAIGNVNEGNNGTGLGLSPGFVFFGADQGAGATLVTADPAPPYTGSTYSRSSYYKFGCQKANPDDGGDDTWSLGVSYNGGVLATQIADSRLGSSGVVNTVQVALVQSYSNRQDNTEDMGACIGSVFDSRVVDGPGLISGESKPGWHSSLEVDGKYIYIALFVMTDTTEEWTDGTYITIEDMRYISQPMRNRSLT